MTLHVLINPSRGSLAAATIALEDTLVLAGAAIALGSAPFSGVALYALATDCDHWGFTLPEEITPLTNGEWVDMAAAADRIIHW